MIKGDIDRTAQGPCAARIAVAVRHLRAERGLTAQQVADLATKEGYPTARSTLANLERGSRREVTVDEAVALARALDVDPAELLFGDIVGEALRRRAAELPGVCARCEGRIVEGDLIALAELVRAVRARHPDDGGAGQHERIAAIRARAGVPTWETCVACSREYAWPHLCREHRLCGTCHPPIEHQET